MKYICNVEFEESGKKGTKHIEFEIDSGAVPFNTILMAVELVKFIKEQKVETQGT